MKIILVKSESLLRACRSYLGQDPVANVLPLGDLYQPLYRVSEVYSAVESNQVLGVCSIYRAASTPSIVFGAETRKTKQALVEHAVSKVSDCFISLCPLDDAFLFERCSTVVHSHFEQQMIARHPKSLDHHDINVARARKNETALLSKFYADHHSEAWTPIQFEAGPYYCVKHEGKIVCSAGVHLVAPQIAQLGNIITDEAHRNQGLATACTGRLAKHLASKGRIMSLFVRKDNTPAIHMYEKLGFSKERDIEFRTMKVNHRGKG